MAPSMLNTGDHYFPHLQMITFSSFCGHGKNWNLSLQGRLRNSSRKNPNSSGFLVNHQY